MTDSTTNLLLANLSGTAASSQNRSTSLSSSLSSSLNSSFSQVLSSSLMSSGMGNLGSSSGLSGDSSSSAMSMMLPLMLMLLEQITKLTAEMEAATQSSNTSSTEASTEVSAGSSTQKAAHGEKSAESGSGDNAEPIGRPVGGSITQAYGGKHNGLDFGIVTGTPVKSTQAGKVIYSGWNNEGYGNLVIVQNGAYRTYYAHLSSLPVQAGDSVSAGQVVGYSGSTGNSTGPHLHYEIRINGVAVDPTSRTLNSGVNW